MKIGDRVKLIDYKKHPDWQQHSEEIGKIIAVNPKADYAIRIQWENGHTSASPQGNIIVLENCTKTEDTLRNIIEKVIKEIRNA